MRAVYAYRDVRDVVFSLMHKRGMTFEQAAPPGNDPSDPGQRSVLDGAAATCWFSGMTTCSPTRPEACIELARHLGIALEESEAARIAAEYSHESNKARAEALRSRLQEAGRRSGEGGQRPNLRFPTTLLHWNHMRQPGTRFLAAPARPAATRDAARLCERWLRRGYEVAPAPARGVSLAQGQLRELRDVSRSTSWWADCNVPAPPATRRFPDRPGDQANAPYSSRHASVCDGMVRPGLFAHGRRPSGRNGRAVPPILIEPTAIAHGRGASPLNADRRRAPARSDQAHWRRSRGVRVSLFRRSGGGPRAARILLLEPLANTRRPGRPA